MEPISEKVWFDSGQLNFHSIFENATYRFFYDDAQLEIGGASFADIYELRQDDDSLQRSTLFVGPDITIDSAGSLDGGTITGFFQLFFDGTEWRTQSSIQDISIPATSIRDAAGTMGTDDDAAIIRTLFSGEDAFMLSAQNDVARAYGGDDLMRGGSGDDELFGEAGNDVIFGELGDDTLFGGSGADELSGGSGNDRLFGQKGRDRLFLDDGNDVLDGGPGTDWLQVDGSRGARVKLGNRGEQDTEYGTDVIRGIENISGGDGNDRFAGTRGANSLFGNGGDDTLKGRNGRDVLSGGEGDDTLLGGGGGDRLHGGNGKDLMDAGRDAERDVFIFSNAEETARGSRRDHILQFDSNEDIINLRRIDADLSMAGNQKFAFSENGRDANSIWLQERRADIVVSGDIDGDGRADFQILVQNVQQLDDQDFLL